MVRIGTKSAPLGHKSKCVAEQANEHDTAREMACGHPGDEKLKSIFPIFLSCIVPSFLFLVFFAVWSLAISSCTGHAGVYRRGRHQHSLTVIIHK